MLINIKKITAAVLVLILLLSGCRTELSDLQEAVQEGISFAASSPEQEASADVESITSVRIPYDEEDGLHPYTCQTVVNRYICGLLYGSLVLLNTDFSTSLSYAEHIVPSEGNMVWEITVRSGLLFSDGTECGADDLRYSILQAAAEGSYFQKSLESVSSVTKNGSYGVTVVLSDADRHFDSLLVFPLIKNGSADAPVALPGRYSLSEDGTQLLCNSDAKIQTVELVKLADHSMLLQETRLGVYDIVYSDDPTGISVTSVGGMETMSSSNLVYVGMNSGRSFLNNLSFRQALSLALDTEAVCEEIYRGYAEPAKGPFSPAFYDAAHLASYSCDLQAANQILDDLGYENRSGEDYRLVGQSELSLDILVCSDTGEKTELAAFLSETIESLGIRATVTALAYEKYLAAVEAGNFDLYLAEVKLGDNMDLGPLVLSGVYADDSGGSLAYGMPTSESLSLAWLGYEDGTVSAADFSEAFYSVMPFLPICYRESAAVYSRNFSFEIGATEQDLFHGILSWGS